MKIAIASEGESVDSAVSSLGGRAPYYLIFDNNELAETIKNPFAVGGGGAGWSVAHLLAEKGVEKVIAGKIGPNMAQALENKNLKFEEAPDKTVAEAIAG